MTGATASLMHGGPDSAGVPAHDFSTNANACGPCPAALQSVRGADVLRYPDATYTALRDRLARLHGVAPQRIVLATSASEFIVRMTATAFRRGIRHVQVPRHAYGEYRHAARAWGLEVSCSGSALEQGRREPMLSWACDPSSPLGQADDRLHEWVRACAARQAIGVLDRAYEPLRLTGRSTLDEAQLDGVWQLHSPNKALGLTGVRGAYAVAPQAHADIARAMESLCASWPLGADGVAMLRAWCEPEVRSWFAQSIRTLKRWKRAQGDWCGRVGWPVTPSDTNFFCARLGTSVADVSAALRWLRAEGLKLRDCESFGLPGMVRLAVLPPASQAALAMAWARYTKSKVERCQVT